MGGIVTLNLPHKETPRPRASRPRKRAYAAAQINRLLLDWYGGLLSPDLELRGDLPMLRMRSRQLIRDNPHAAGFLRALKDNVAGPYGMQFSPRILTPAGDLDRAENTALKRAWKAWGRVGVCTVDGGLSFVEVQRLVIATVARDGEFLAIRRRGYRNGFGYALQLLDADYLDDGYHAEPTSPGSNRISMGVEYNADGRAVAYYLWDRHPSERLGRQRTRVPADQVVHLYMRERPGQSRGIPWLVPAMVRLKMLDAYEEAHITAARVGTVKPWWVQETEAPAGEVPPPAGEAQEEEKVRLDLEPGMGGYLPYGFDVKFFDSKFPSTSFAEFQKSCLRSIASGIGVAYETFANDRENVNYGSMRGGSLNERDAYRALHRWFAEAFLEPEYAAWLPQAMAWGGATLASRDPADYLDAGQFYGRGWDWVDPEKDMSTFEREYAMGLNSLQRKARELGRDIEEVFAEKAQELELAEEYGITIGGPEAIATAIASTVTTEEETDADADPERPTAQATDDDDDRDDTGRGRQLLRLRPHPRRAVVGSAR